MKLSIKYIVGFCLLLSSTFGYSQNKTNIIVQGTCGMCKDRIESNAILVQGVNSAEYNIEKQLLSLDVQDDFNVLNLHLQLSSVGHDTDEMKASESSYLDLPDCCHYRPEIEDSSVSSLDNSNYSTTVSGVCGACKARIESTSMTVDGVVSASYDIEQQLLSIERTYGFDELKLQQAIAKAGHDTEQVKATEEDYNALPGCCKYKEVPIHLTEEELFQVRGVIYELNKRGKEIPLIGATVQWKGDAEGTSTDDDGYFNLQKKAGYDTIQVNYVGYGTEYIDMSEESMVKVVLSNNIVMDEVGISARKKSASVSYLETIHTVKIAEEELLKAACCNLAESFVTTSSIDNTVADAVTGTKKIEMLGLAGPYMMLSRENMPDSRALSSISGLTYTSGPWIESIQINPGVASVVNGFEGMTGQINVELKNPESAEKLMLHVYGNQGQRLEANMTSNMQVNENVRTALLLHGSTRTASFDNNQDGFMDNPNGTHFLAMNRWKWYGKKGWRGQTGVKIINSDHLSGVLDVLNASDSELENLWHAKTNTKRYEFFNKAGVIFPNHPTRSIGTQLSFVYHDQADQFGKRNYQGIQKSLYANFLFQDQIYSKKHKIRLGSSFQWDIIEENVLDFAQTLDYNRNEWVPGVFSEYTYSASSKFNVVAGLRADYHNNYGLFATPRVHFRYAPKETTVFRLSAGKGLKTANVFADQMGSFASSRKFVIQGDVNSDNPYGLKPEIAWNIGLNISQGFTILDHEHSLQLDVYRTEFTNQIVVDLDQNPQEVNIYNLDGKSFSNSIQIQYETTIFTRLDVRLAYRYNDVRTTYSSIGLAQRPLVSPQRGFVNLAYTTQSDWSFDFTLNWIGEMRLPSYGDNPVDYQWETSSPAYFLGFAHISKRWNDKWEAFVGVENAFNYQQENAIIANDDPFGDYFDASLIWGPIFGRNIYIGGRFILK